MSGRLAVVAKRLWHLTHTAWCLPVDRSMLLRLW